MKRQSPIDLAKVRAYLRAAALVEAIVGRPEFRVVSPWRR